MKYENPTLEFWDLEDEPITTSLGSKPENSEGGDDDRGDFEWDW